MDTELPYPLGGLINRKWFYAFLLIYICHCSGVVEKDPDMFFVGII